MKSKIAQSLVIAGCFLLPSLAVAKALTVTVPLKGTESLNIQTCNGETANGSIDVNAVIHVTLDSSGGELLVIAGSVKGSAIGSSTGALYQFNESVNENINVKRATEVTLGIRIRLIGQGGVPDGYARLLIHVTMNAKGDITAFFETVSEDCFSNLG